jgi:signal transduction histidine kinase
MQNLRVEHKGHQLFVLLGMITVLLASAMVFAVIRFRDYSRVFANTHEVLTAIVSLEASATHAESSARAYLLTGNESFLKEFIEKRAETEQDEKLLGELQAGTIEETQRFLELSAAVSRRMEHLTQVAALRKAGVSVATITSEDSEEGRRLTAAIGTLIGAAKAKQGRQLADRRARRRQIDMAVLTLCGFGALVSVSLVLVGIRAMRNDLRLRNEAQEDLRRANAELEERVLERTASIQQANAELQRSQAELSTIANALERSNVELESFAYAATHDLLEPLRTVTLFAQLLQRHRGDASSSEEDFYLQTIVSAADRMTELIQGVLEYSRVSREPIEPGQPVDLNEVQAIVKANLSAQIGESGAEITHSHLPTLIANRLQLIRLMQNLIGNSLKYRSLERGCRIDVNAEKQGEFWTISVQDNGVGFRAEYEQYIFGMFKRLDRERAGAGVGLATCQTIVERYGGRIWAEAEEGKGATFHFTWPVAQSELAYHATQTL